MRNAISIDAFEASRDIPELGINEQAGFLGHVNSRIFAVLHSPVGICSGGVLICPPLYGESPRNYRREVLLARTLAARGIAALRFHYRGTGHSDGDVEDTTFTRFCEDASVAVSYLTSAIGGRSIALFGTRLGGCVAAATAAHSDNVIALWQPVVTGRDYFREIFRLQRMGELSAAAEVAEEKRSPLDRLNDQGSVDLMGYFVGRELYDSVVTVDTTDLLKQTKGPILVVQIARQEVGDQYRSLIDDLRRSGRTIDVAHVHAHESWWFSHGPDALWETSEPARLLLDITSDWLTHALVTEGAT